jgi:hypothetical protein
VAPGSFTCWWHLSASSFITRWMCSQHQGSPFFCFQQEVSL